MSEPLFSVHDLRECDKLAMVRAMADEREPDEAARLVAACACASAHQTGRRDLADLSARLASAENLAAGRDLLRAFLVELGHTLDEDLRAWGDEMFARLERALPA